MELISLCECDRNRKYIIEKIECESVGVARRLSELGFYKGAKIRVSCFSALKKTVLLEIEGYTVSLRSTIASCVKVLEAGK